MNDVVEKSNIIQGPELISALQAAMKELSTLLTNFCGPFSSYAASPSFGAELRPTEYTKDGINILEYTQFSDPEAQFCRNLIGYVGKQVDRICNDGTTTAMLFASLLAEGVLQLSGNTSRVQMRKYVQEIQVFIAYLERRLSTRKLTVEGLFDRIYPKLADSKRPKEFEKFRKKVVYWASMTSTKGDVEISQALTEAALSYPKEFYNHRRVGTLAVEKEQRVIVETQESNFVVNAAQVDYSIKGNKALGDVFDYGESYLSVGTQDLCEGLFPAKVMSAIVRRYLDGELVLDRPWYITAPQIQSAELISAVQSYNRTENGRSFPIVLLSFYYGDPLLNATMAKAIAICAGHGNYYVIDDCQTQTLEHTDIKFPCSVKLIGHRLEISDLYTKIEGPYHPFYYDKTKTRYHALVKDMDDRLAMDRHKKAGAGNNTLDQLLYIKRCVLAQNLKDLMVAGRAHDSEANKSVVTDALGTVIDTLQEGFVLSGFVDMYLDTIDYDGIQVSEEIITIFKNTFSSILEATYGHDVTKTKAFRSYTNSTSARDTRYLAALMTGAVRHGSMVKDVKNGDTINFPIIQPYRGFQAQLMRVGDVVPKLSRLHALMLNK